MTKTNEGDWFGDHIAIPTNIIHSCITLIAGFKYPDTEKWGITGAFGDAKYTQSLFYNGIFFLRIIFPFGIFIGFRWSGKTDRKAFLQTGIGWKLNGRFGVLCRIQSDTEGAAGVSGYNSGQATGWEFGTK